MRVEFTSEEVIDGKKLFVQIDGEEDIRAYVLLTLDDDVLFEGTPTEAVIEFARLLASQRTPGQ